MQPATRWPWCTRVASAGDRTREDAAAKRQPINLVGGVVATIDDIRRFSSRQKVVSYVELILGCANRVLVWHSMAASASAVAVVRAPC
jgi:hypothetical protein